MDTPQPCPLCDLEPDQHERVWHAFAQRLDIIDARRVARKVLDNGAVTTAQVREHLFDHHWVQPSPLGKLHRSSALQEALSNANKAFPRYVFYLLRAIYRAGAMSQRQIYAMFYLDHAEDGPKLRERMNEDLRRLVFRSYLYQHWPENRGAMGFDDPGPFYYLNRQAIPLVEKLEGLPPGELPFQKYVTSIEKIKEHHLETDYRFNDVIIALRQKLYRRVFHWGEREMTAHLAIEHWFSSAQLVAHLKLGDDQEVNFAPAALTGLRLETRDGALSTLLPLWLEYDRGLDEPAQVVESVLCYAVYYRSETYRKMFPRLAEHRSPGPLIVMCENAYRRDEIAVALKAALGDRHVPVYLTERPTFLTDPYAQGILLSATHHGQRFSLLDRLAEHNRPLIEHRAFSGSDHLTDLTVDQVLRNRAEQPQQAAGAQGPPKDLSARFDLEGWGTEPQQTDA